MWSPLRQAEVYHAIFYFDGINGSFCWTFTAAITQIEPPSVHGAFDASGWIDETTNQRATTVGTTILDGVNDSINIEKGDFDTVDLDELTATSGEFVEAADFGPGLGHRENVEESSQESAFSRKIGDFGP